MAFLKIVCIVATTLGLHVASTSPNPPLRPSERTITPTSMECILVSPSFRGAQKLLYWVAALAESALVVAQLNPRSTPSQWVIATLALGGGRLTTCLSAPLALGFLLISGGALLRLQCYRVLGRHFTFETGIVRGHRLVTTGPYATVRHPSYTGAILAYLGLLCYYGSPGSWLVECVAKGSTAGTVFCGAYAGVMSLVVSGLLSRISKEDAGLKREFGAEWDLYAARVPYVLIPGMY
ncbi:hypothetical protein DFH07DRAFT_912221 [Mycena maculata]|uniref:Protein-S-isoprenylcysteine O-methyltransferase n=1 Tax=Mycena maculata TaxID=230809 RepID=A0AAD7K0L1_9AGAR|nr:hypothetical protein DFH07DRAFT_912221 [Mycena maculata]